MRGSGGVLGGVKFCDFFRGRKGDFCLWGLAIALSYPRRAKKGEKIAPWSHFFANFSNIPPDPKKFKGRSRDGVGGAKFSDGKIRHFFRKNGGRGLEFLVNLGVDIIQGVFFRNLGGSGGGLGGVLGGYIDNFREIYQILWKKWDIIKIL